MTKIDIKISKQFHIVDACTKGLRAFIVCFWGIQNPKKQLCHHNNFTINLESWAIEIGGNEGFPSFYKCRASQDWCRNHWPHITYRIDQKIQYRPVYRPCTANHMGSINPMQYRLYCISHGVTMWHDIGKEIKIDYHDEAANDCLQRNSTIQTYWNKVYFCCIQIGAYSNFAVRNDSCNGPCYES